MSLFIQTVFSTLTILPVKELRLFFILKGKHECGKIFKFERRIIIRTELLRSSPRLSSCSHFLRNEAAFSSSNIAASGNRNSICSQESHINLQAEQVTLYWATFITIRKERLTA
jgi:hypothetical protein